jgi:hypothetical protein
MNDVGPNERHVGDFVGGRGSVAHRRKRGTIGEVIATAAATASAANVEVRVDRAIERTSNATIYLAVADAHGEIPEALLSALRLALGRDARVETGLDRWYGEARVVIDVSYGEPSIFDEVHPMLKTVFVAALASAVIACSVVAVLVAERAGELALAR